MSAMGVNQSDGACVLTLDAQSPREKEAMLSKMRRMLAGTCLALATLAMVAAASAQDLIEYALMSGFVAP